MFKVLGIGDSSLESERTYMYSHMPTLEQDRDRFGIKEKEM